MRHKSPFNSSVISLIIVSCATFSFQTDVSRTTIPESRKENKL